MTLTPDTIVEGALQLPHKSRAVLAEKLLDSLEEGDDFEVSEAWREEIRRRCKEIDTGTVELTPAEQVFDELDEETG